MSPDPYREAHDLHQRLQAAADQIGRVLARTEALARHADRDELHDHVDVAVAAAGALEQLLDWIEESDLPPGLRTAIGAEGAHELSSEDTLAGPNPIQAGEPLAALVHTQEMGEAYDEALLDLTDLGLDGYDPADPAHRHYPYRFRLRAIAEPLDPDAGPLEHASLYFDASGARRTAALLRRQVRESES